MAGIEFVTHRRQYAAGVVWQSCAPDTLPHALMSWREDRKPLCDLPGSLAPAVWEDQPAQA
jgi:hypothetical protein